MSRLKKASNKQKPQNDLQQYYADDMIEEESSGTEVRQRPARNVAVIEEEDNEEEVQYNIEGDQNKEKLKKENMDKISDILVSMIFKNKVNSKNAFDIPLPNVEKLTDFHQATGDTSWKKLSQTLDAGAKIYGFRVDSVHNEAYKVLGGLNRTELNQEEQAPELARGVDDDDQDTQDNVVRRQKRDGDGEGTLEKNLHNIDTNKYDLEFDIDPLFQKTSAKFDEGGAKGLLMNNLCIDEQLHLMFDSGNIFDLGATDPQQQRRAALSRAFFKEIDFGSDLLKHKICPELSTFKQTYLKDSKDYGADNLQFDKLLDELHVEEEIEQNLRFENIEVNADQILNDIIEARGEGDFHDPQPFEPYSYPNDEVQIGGVGTQITDTSMTQHFVDHRTGDDGEIRNLNFNSIEERLASLGFGQSLNALLPESSKNWMGPEAWKLNKLKDKSVKVKEEKKPKKEGKNKKKEQIPVDFNMAVKESWKDVFGIVSTSRKKNEKKSPQKAVAEPAIKQAYLLPIDRQIKPFRLANLFSRGLYKTRGGADRERAAPLKEDYDFAIDNDIDHMPQDQIDPVTQDEIQQNLSTIFGAANKSEVQFDRPERFINIKVLKEKMWGYLADRLPEIPASDQNFDDTDGEDNEEEIAKAKKKPQKKKKKDIETEGMTFADICKQLPSFVGDQQNKNISVHSCFVTILHLANEKGLRFKKDPNGFNIFKETTA